MAVDMFLEIPGCPGESQKDGHKDQIEIMSFSFGVSQTGTFAKGGQGGGAGKANFEDINLVKEVDKATPVLFKACASGKHFDKATIFVRKAGEKPLEYYKIVMTDVMISSSQKGGTAHGDSLTESVTLNFAVLEETYVEQDNKGGAGKTVTAGYNVREGKTL